MIPIPKVALVGRPNVGKSTLFNRIAGSRKAITDRKAGSTRDRNYAQVSWQGAGFELIDTGGLLLGTKDPLLGSASEQAQRAIDEAELVIFVVDARTGRLPADETIARTLRRAGKRVVVAVNKSERNDGLEEFAPLGFEAMVLISAEHGLGVGDLLDAALQGLRRVPVPEVTHPPLRLALVGRPNVGKSSLLNSILGAPRALVSPLPGTTRDAVDSTLERNGTQYLFVDTAGIRRARHLKENVDYVSVAQARRAIERADVGILVLDAVEGMKEMDAAIGGYLQKAGRGVVIAVNKWDRSDEHGLRRRDSEVRIREDLKFLSYAPVVFVSAKTGKGVPELLKAAARVREAGQKRIPTGILNRFIAEAVSRHAPKATKGNRVVKVLFAAQIGVEPPTFLLSLNHPVELHFSYKRYLENQLRIGFGFEGTPLVFKVRARPH